MAVRLENHHWRLCTTTRRAEQRRAIRRRKFGQFVRNDTLAGDSETGRGQTAMVAARVEGSSAAIAVPFPRCDGPSDRQKRPSKAHSAAGNAAAWAAKQPPATAPAGCPSSIEGLSRKFLGSTL